MSLPANLKGGRILVALAELPPVPVWTVSWRLDGGEVAHVQHLGILPYREGETATELMGRAKNLAQAHEE